jgi:hypothetical protein
MQRGAAQYRGELARLEASGIHWIDYSSPADWGSFALANPLDLCLGIREGRTMPVMRSPRFHTMFDPATYAVLSRNKRRMHMQYLMAGDRPSDYDYFAITAGATPFAQRLASPPPP